MTASVLQSAQHAASASTVSATLGSAPTPGNTVLAFINSDDVFTVTAGGTRRFTYLADQQYDIWEWTSGTLPQTVTVTPGVADNVSIVLIELAGVGAFDVVGTVATASSAATVTAAGITTTAAGDIVLVAAGMHGASSVPASPTYGNSFTAVTAALDGGTGGAVTSMLVGKKVLVSAGAVGATAVSWTNAAVNEAAVQIAYLDAGAPPAVATPCPSNFTKAAVQRASSW